MTFAKDYDRMWPDTWSGRKKIYFFSWDGTSRNWKLPADWSDVPLATLYPLTPDGRGKGVPIAIKERDFAVAPAAGSLHPRSGHKMTRGSQSE